jgi:dienelactone hydrolase
MKSRNLPVVSLRVVATLCWTATAFGRTPSPGMNVVTIRGERQEIYYLPASGTPLHQSVLFVPGVGGWRGWAVTIAETMASWGYDVYGVDTKTYLDSFSGRGTLTEAEVTNDMCELADWAANGFGTRVTFVGWSEGAGLGVLGAAGVASKSTFAGLITFGLSDENVIAWHWSENLTSLIKNPHEPTFRAGEYMGKVAPLPLWMIQSSHDQYVGLDEAKRLFAAAHEPKRFELVEADNHRFDGNHQEFFVELRDGLQWVSHARPASLQMVK